jgi:predicted metal-dependent peptidase
MSAAAKLAVEKARWWALTHEPFYGSLAMSLADVFDPSQETACTDGKVIRWNPEYVESLPIPQQRFVLFHETLHPGHLHLWRLPATERGNRAGDYAINLILAKLCQKWPGELEMPPGALLDPQYEGLAEEEIFGRLRDEPEDPGGGGGGDGGQPGDQQSQPSGGGGQQPDSGGGSQQPPPLSGGGKPDVCGSFTAPAADEAAADGGAGEREALHDMWETKVIQAAQAAQALGEGDIPGDMERLLERMRHQSVDWRQEMVDFVRNAASTRNDWSRSSRRHAWQSVIYPRRRADEVGKVIFARDTSGSISNEICAQFSALVTDCVSEMGCEGLVIDCDAAIKAEYIITDGEECPDTAKGGGGTDFRPVFDRANELTEEGEQIAGIVYLTDLDARPEKFPDSTSVATLWMATADRQAPFGRTVRVES